MEEYMQKRDEIRRMVGDSEFFDRKTELNLGVVSLALKLELCRLAKRMWRKLEKSENDAWSSHPLTSTHISSQFLFSNFQASLAGAQLEIDKRITTRRMSRKLHDECGIKEQDILYKGLDYHGTETRASKELRDSRQASIIESCVDFQKQMQWKIGIMDQVKAKANPCGGRTYPLSDGPSIRTRGGQDKQREDMKKQKKEIEKIRKARRGKEDDPFKTPQKKVEFNALDERRIIENYQLEVASEVRTHRPTVQRSIAPIPFNINILGEDDEDEDMEH
ncbi:hypothetical protein CAEBREN_01157 [Caenorhabditis brenneri]|uniref:Uncharacterized protein n=1 Tax=Caenorhabditis brenneri TaxID=135651 RepID=G0NLZ3_CAEBE|nr:hypothetical protein CAEBREN_01157 [Caenorhabditis brenneri]